MKKLIFSLFIFGCLFFNSSLKAQYSINIDVKGNKDSILILGYYYLDNTYAIDTAVNKKGKFSFEKKDKTLDPGIYFVSNTNGKYIEFIIDKEQKFSLSTLEEDWMKNMTVSKSKDNEIYYDYIRSTTKLSVEANELGKKKKELGEENFNKQIAQINEKNDSIKNVFMKTYPNHLLSKVLEATQYVEIPKFDNIYKKDGSVDSSAMQNQKYNYYIHHYFDNFDFQCDGLLRTPKAVFHQTYNYYWNEMMKYQTKDSIFNLAVYWIEKARGSKLMFKYMVHDITERYLKSPYMGHDEIYINMINRYYASGDATWMPPSAIDKEVARARKWENSMLLKTVPDLACPDTNGNVHNLYSLNSKYKILIFWAYDCGHCQTEIPKVFTFYKNFKDVYNVEVMAVNSGTDVQLWKNKVKSLNLEWLNVNGLVANYDWHDYFDVESTPLILILDKDNRIIGKKVPASNIENYIKLYDEGKIKL
ncbi:MAG: hypothetical protein H6Q16_953 [Bacteroidetes bacterium]|nr:hypothetical protein [Bacteroidota bacterium]